MPLKKFYKILFFFLLVIVHDKILQAQNLVLNPSFEEYNTCPVYISGVDSNFQWVVNNWDVSAGSPDYYNICNQGEVAIPHNFFGYQNSANGMAYAGIYTYLEYSYPYREFLICQLNSPLVIGSRYYFSYKVSLADSCNCASNNINLLFSTVYKYWDVNNQLPNFSHFKLDAIVSDTSSWTTITGSFISDSAYKYINIGNFYYDAYTDIIFYPTRPVNHWLNSAMCNSYYYIDDVCLSTDFLTCDKITDLPVISMTQEIEISPNPVVNKLNISISENQQKLHILIEIFNSQGIILNSYNPTNKNIYQIDFSIFSKGIYFIKIQTNNKLVTKKIVKL